MFVSRHLVNNGFQNFGALLSELFETGVQQLVLAVERPDGVEEPQARDDEERGCESIAFGERIEFT